MKRDLLKLSDLTRAEMLEIFDITARLKSERKRGVAHPALAGKSVGMLFNKSSTRTRISFEVGIYQLGGQAVVLSGDRIQMGRGETPEDTARVFSRYLDALVIRTFAHEEAEVIARASTMPVINALTDKYHPCQILADMFTIIERRGSLDGVKVAYVGDGNNVSHSWLLGSAVMGIKLSVATPKGYEPAEDVVAEARKLAASSGAVIGLTHDPREAVKGADVVYTDTWISMGQDDEAEIRRKAFDGYMVDSALMAAAGPGAIFMHCLPAHRGEEVSAEVMDGPNSAVWDEAENRLHVQKAVLMKFVG
ncbi:MAG: ornithine carbamoyltransferase [Nitrospinae bacterium]|nr:ornithine carbamoyltransferase [Nitrospinota bacterium]